MRKTFLKHTQVFLTILLLGTYTLTTAQNQTVIDSTHYKFLLKEKNLPMLSRGVIRLYPKTLELTTNTSVRIATSNNDLIQGLVTAIDRDKITIDSTAVAISEIKEIWFKDKYLRNTAIATSTLGAAAVGIGISMRNSVNDPVTNAVYELASFAAIIGGAIKLLSNLPSIFGLQGHSSKRWHYQTVQI